MVLLFFNPFNKSQSSFRNDLNPPALVRSLFPLILTRLRG
jgi:hypothetical protein